MPFNQQQADMRAVEIREFGASSVLTQVRADLPDAQADEVLVRIVATSVNPVDYKIRQGKFPPIQQEQLPVTLGRDVSGVVELVGSPSFSLKVGDEVYGMPAFGRGSYAEFVVMRGNEVALKPGTLDGVEAGSVPLAALTAWQGLFDHGGLQAGQRVLIHGGSGGVGHFAVQFARAKGATVVTTVSERDLDFAREIGADIAIDYKNERFEDKAGEVDLVLDLIGGETQERSWSVVKNGGAIVSALSEPNADKATAKNVRVMRYMAKPNAHQLTEIAALIDKREVRVVISEVFPLDQISKAHDFAEKGGFRGKVGIRI